MSPKSKHARVVAAAVLCVLLGAAASAQDRADATRGSMEFGFRHDGRHLVIHVDGDDVEVLADGEEMPAERLQRHGGVLRCLDRNGCCVIAELHLIGGGGTLRRLATDCRGRASLGVVVQDCEEALCSQLGLERDSVVCVTEVTEGGAADRAGLRKHDVILEIDGAPPATRTRLGEVLERSKPGDELRLRIVRGGERREIVVELGAKKPGARFLGPSTTGYLQLAPLLSTRPDLLRAYVGPPRKMSDAYDYNLLLDRARPAAKTDADLDRRLTKLENSLESLERLLTKLERRIK